jgi:hypothetical protein
MIHNHMSNDSLSTSITMSVKIFNSINSCFLYLCLIPGAIILFGIDHIHNYVANRRLIQAAPNLTYQVGEYLSNH